MTAAAALTLAAKAESYYLSPFQSPPPKAPATSDTPDTPNTHTQKDARSGNQTIRRDETKEEKGAQTPSPSPLAPSSSYNSPSSEIEPFDDDDDDDDDNDGSETDTRANDILRRRSKHPPTDRCVAIDTLDNDRVAPVSTDPLGDVVDDDDEAIAALTLTSFGAVYNATQCAHKHARPRGTRTNSPSPSPSSSFLSLSSPTSSNGNGNSTLTLSLTKPRQNHDQDLRSEVEILTRSQSKDQSVPHTTPVQQQDHPHPHPHTRLSRSGQYHPQAIATSDHGQAHLPRPTFSFWSLSSRGRMNHFGPTSTTDPPSRIPTYANPSPPASQAKQLPPLYAPIAIRQMGGEHDPVSQANKSHPGSSMPHGPSYPSTYTPTTIGDATDPSSSLSPGGGAGVNIQAPLSGNSRRRRGRLATACGECNRRKQRCDGNEPCGLCLKRGVGHACTYPVMQASSWAALPEQRSSPDNTDSRLNKRQRHGHPSSGSFSAQSAGNSTTASGDNATPQHPESSAVAGHVGDGNSRTTDHNASHSSQDDRHSSDPLSQNRSISRGLPISSDRHSSAEQAVRKHTGTPKRSKSPEAAAGNRFWRSHNDVRIETETIPSSGTGKTSGTSSESEQLMEESEAYGVGSMRPQRGPWDNDEGEKTFFGTSHFGPQLAVKVLRRVANRQNQPIATLGDMRVGPSRGIAEMDRTKPYTLESQTRELVSCIPAKEECDRYVRRFFERYNAHNDIIPEPEFMQSYADFWQLYNIRTATEVDLRQLALLLIVLAFGVLLDYAPEQIRQRRAKLEEMELPEQQAETITAMLNDLEAQSPTLKDRKEKSAQWSWAASRALSESCSFFAESLDTIRAGLLMSLYLNVCRRVPEAWAAIGTAIRAAQARGLHVDGSSWKGMSPKEAELRRRLWAQLYIVDRSISLFLGRPVSIQDGQFTTDEPANLHDDELETTTPLSPRPLTTPTKTTFLILHYRLAQIIGHVQLTCFNLSPRQYNDVLACEDKFRAFKANLPPHFRLDGEGTDYSLDYMEAYRWLPMQRQTLNSKFHLARISLHRPYIFRAFTPQRPSGQRGRVVNPYMSSREPLLYSSIADLRLRIDQNEHDPLDRFKWMTVASGFFASSIIGILCHVGYKDPRFNATRLRELLQQYIAMEEKTVRRDEMLEMELNVLRLMEARALEREELGAGRRERSASASASRFPARGRSTSSTRAGGAHRQAYGGTLAGGLGSYYSTIPLPQPFQRDRLGAGTNVTPPVSAGVTGPGPIPSPFVIAQMQYASSAGMGLQPLRSPYDSIPPGSGGTSTLSHQQHHQQQTANEWSSPSLSQSDNHSGPSQIISNDAQQQTQPSYGSATGSASGMNYMSYTTAGGMDGNLYSVSTSNVNPYSYISTNNTYNLPLSGTMLNATPSSSTGGAGISGSGFPFPPSASVGGASGTLPTTTVQEGEAASGAMGGIPPFMPFATAAELQSWLQPLENDPTGLGLPDASEGMAWEAILATDINFELDSDHSNQSATHAPAPAPAQALGLAEDQSQEASGRIADGGQSG